MSAPSPQKRPAQSGRQRVSLRMIAAAADVSVMTVSYALRGNAEVSAPERARIQRLAEELGYRPDPLITHLMHHLRSHRTLKSAANLAVLTMLDAGFVQRLLAGALARAGRLGYQLDRIDARAYVSRPGSLTRTLKARGISGVLLAPVEDAADYSGLIDWSLFAAVAMTYSVVEPRVHRVVTHHFDNALRAIALLDQRGFRRIGLAMTSDMEFRANHSYSGAYHRAVNMEGNEPLPILLLDQVGRAGTKAWFNQHRPTAILVANSNHVREIIQPALGARLTERVPIVSLDYDVGEKVPGMDQVFEVIGGHAVDALVAQLHRNERGLPENPTVNMVHGRWVEPG